MPTVNQITTKYSFTNSVEWAVTLLTVCMFTLRQKKVCWKHNFDLFLWKGNKFPEQKNNVKRGKSPCYNVWKIFKEEDVLIFFQEKIKGQMVIFSGCEET